jgi:hypothetical protein
MPAAEPPDCIDTDGPFGPIVVAPLSPPEPVLIVVEFDEGELCNDEDAPLVVSCWTTRQGLLLSTTIVVPPLSPVTIDTLAPPALVLVLLSADAGVASNRAAPAAAIKFSAMDLRMVGLLRIYSAR